MQILLERIDIFEMNKVCKYQIKNVVQYKKKLNMFKEKKLWNVLNSSRIYSFYAINIMHKTLINNVITLIVFKFGVKSSANVIFFYASFFLLWKVNYTPKFKKKIVLELNRKIKGQYWIYSFLGSICKKYAMQQHKIVHFL